MAPFNQRQIGYIQAIAGRQQHVTLIAGQHDGQLKSSNGPTTEQAPQTFKYKKVTSPWQCRPNLDPASALQTLDPNTSPATDPDCKSLLMYTWNLDSSELGFDSRTVHNDESLTSADFTNLRSAMLGMGPNVDLNCFDAAVEGYHVINTEGAVPDDARSTGALVRNPELIPSDKRATQDGFLNSTDIKFRFTLPAGYSDKADHEPDHPMGQDHYEFRWIVWRHKKPTMHNNAIDSNTHTNLEAVRDGASFRNPGYDFFMGQTGRKRGFLGYTLNKNLDKDVLTTLSDSEAYSGKYYNGTAFVDGQSTKLAAPGDAGLTVDDLLTTRINKDDYVVMKDVRFFLGKEHGKSHFEDHLHWDWNDPIDTPHDNVLSSPTLNNKNYRWHMTLIGTNNGRYNTIALNHCVRWTTKMESG